MFDASVSIPRIFRHTPLLLATVVLSWVASRVLDPTLVTRAPVDLAKISPVYVVSLEKLPKKIIALTQDEKNTWPCPSSQCPLNTTVPAGLTWKTITKPYPMIADWISPNTMDGKLFVRLDIPRSEHHVPGMQLAFDVLGVNGRSWRFFVDGAEIAQGLGGLLDKPLVFPMPANAQTITLGFEIDVGKVIAPGIHTSSQPFISSPEIAELVRSAYRSNDISVVLPVAYMFAGIALLAALGCFFTPFYLEVFFFSLSVTIWTYRHLMANAVIPIPKFMVQDFAAVDAVLKLSLYGCLCIFFNLYFRHRPALTKYYSAALGLAITGVLTASTLAYSYLTIFTHQYYTVLLALTLTYGTYVSARTWHAVRFMKKTSFRRTVAGLFSLSCSIPALVYLVKSLSGLLPTAVADILHSYYAEQVQSFWIYLVALGLGTAIALEWALVVSARQHLMKRFGMVVDKKIVNELATHDRIVSRRIDPTVAMFVDMRSFTTRCSGHSANEIIADLNSFLKVVTEQIQLNDGMIDKFVGDGVFAVWGFPAPSPDDCDRAIRAAQGIREGIAKLNAQKNLLGQITLEFGIGIHVGEAVFGAIGSDDYMDFTAIGDVVNVASRIQDVTKKLKTDILVSEAFTRKVGMRATFSDAGSELIRGTQSVLRLYTLESLKHVRVEPNPADQAETFHAA